MASNSRMSRIIGTAAVITVVPLSAWIANQQGHYDTETMLDTSVSIRSISTVRSDEVGDSVWESQAGSGFLVSRDNCEVWTNFHVVRDAARLEVFPRGWPASQGIPARVIQASEQADLAVLSMDHCEGISVAQLGNSDRISAGDPAFAVGNPLGKHPDTISRGIISHTERYLDDPTPYLQTDAMIGPGSSGGALFNRRGEVIGINTGIAAYRRELFPGIAYSIPINLARQVINRIRQPDPGWAVSGFESILAPLSSDQARIFGVPEGLGGVSLTSTPESGPARDLLKAHDVLYRANGKGINSVGELLYRLSTLQPGDPLRLELIRDSRPLEITLQLDDGWKPQPPPKPEYYAGHLGMSLEMWKDAEGEQGQFKTPVITRVQSMGPAHLGRVSSSQHNLMLFGGMSIRRLLDVKTVTGTVIDGRYTRVDSIEQLESQASEAHQLGLPLLLEIEVWQRSNPMQFSSPLERVKTAYYRLNPQLSAAEPPLHSTQALLAQEDSRPD